MSDDLGDRVRELESQHGETRIELTALEGDYRAFKIETQRNVDRLDRANQSCMDELRDLAAKLNDGIERVNTTMNSVTMGALQSAPQWVIQSMERKNVFITFVSGVAMAALGVIAALLIK